MGTMTPEISIKLFTEMLRIRLLEERIADLYADPKCQGRMRTPTHFSIGQEAVSVGVGASLRKDDYVFASHRCHAAYLAKGGSFKEMVAELYGRATGTCRGRAGSAHLSSPENNMYAAPILGGMIPVAVGAALSFSMDKSDQVSVIFLGDAAIEEGVFAESLNFALLKKLPVFFVCENNFFSTHTHIRYRQPTTEIYQRMQGAGIVAEKVDGNDVEAVYGAAKKMIEGCRKNDGPFFLECTTYRYREHVGPLFDFNNPYRTKEEVEEWMKRCPIQRWQKILLERGILDQTKLNEIEKEVRREIDESVRFAEQSPWPDSKTLLDNVH